MDKPLEFKLIATRLSEIFEKKNADYNDAIFKLVEEVGYVALQAHIYEKYLRISNLMKRDPNVVGEYIKDSLEDLANYSIIWVMILEQEQKLKK